MRGDGTVELADDERARVPFALVGVVLLVGSATLTVGVQPERPVARPDVDVAMERGTAEAVTALRRGIRAASAGAGRAPVVVPANTSTGRVLNDSRPFRDALRIRVYLRVRERLRDLAVQSGDVRVRGSLPATPNASALRAAKRRVHLAAVTADRTVLRVRVENVSLTARRGNRTVGEREWGPSVVVRTPVLALHESVERFQRRVNGSLARPGLARRVTGYTYLLTWARGYAQYGGAPVGNVLATRHVEVVTNAGLLQEQRAVFGQSDAGGKRALARAAGRTVATDLSLPTAENRGTSAEVVAEGRAVVDPDRAMPALLDAAESPSPSDGMRVAVNETADHALASLVADGNLSALLADAYTTRARLRVEVHDREGDHPTTPDDPDEDGDWWVERCWTNRSVDGAAEVPGSPAVDPEPGWHTLTTHAATVDETVTRTCRWTNEEGDRERTDESGTVTYEVAVGVVGRHERPRVAPPRGFAAVHERTRVGPFPGSDPNLAGVADSATADLLAAAGGPDEVAADAVAGGRETTAREVTGARPDGLRQWVLDDLARLRSRVRNVSTTVERGRVGALSADPAGRLASELDGRRAEFVAPPGEYANAAERARVAARRAYLDAVVRRLESRSERQRVRRGKLADVLGRLDAGSVDLLDRALENRTTTAATRIGVTGTGVNVTTVDGAPTYLTTAAVDDGTAPALPAGRSVHPLATRNVNPFANPYADVTDLLFDPLGGNESVPFRAAAGTLAAAERTAAPHSTAERAAPLSERHERLRATMTSDLAFVRRRALRRTLAEHGVGDSATERARVVESGLSTWETTGQRALAVSNGSATRAVAAAAATDNRTRRALLRADLRAAVAAATDRPATRVPKTLVRETDEAVRAAVEERLRSATEDAVAEGVNRTLVRATDRLADRFDRTGRSLNRVPAGLPVLPTGTPWWTTVNVWYVEVAGGYERFAVRARRGGAGQVGGSLVYVRDGDPVALDYDRDGDSERVGRSDRVTFRVRTGVVIAVPPGPQGVGDKNGDVDERSAGWGDWAGAGGRVPWAGGE